MNIQAHMSGQLSGQVPNQSATSLPGISQQNGNSLSAQMQNPVTHRNVLNADPEFGRARKIISQRIYDYLVQRLHHANEMPQRKVLDLVKRLEAGLLESASSKEEYMNPATLENRLHILIERLPLSTQSNQFSHVSSSPSIGTMIPTPGMPQSGNSNLIGTSSVDNGNSCNTIVPSNINSENLLPTSHGPPVSAAHGGSFSSTGGLLVNGCQQSPSNFAISSVGTSMVSSMGAQRMASQMIPTPGFNSAGSDAINSVNSSFGTYGNVEVVVIPLAEMQDMKL